MKLPIEILLIPLVSHHAYLDPGSGSILLQVLIGGLLGLGFLVRAFWGRIKGLFKRSAATEEKSPDDES